MAYRTSETAPHIPKALPVSPIAGAVPALQANPHGNHPELRPAAIEQFDVVDRALGRQGVDGNAEVLRQDMRESFAINVIHPARRSRHQGKRLWPIGVGCRTPVDVPMASKQAANTTPVNLDICFSLPFRAQAVGKVKGNERGASELRDTNQLTC